MKITVIKHKNKATTYSRKDMEVFVDEIRSGTYSCELAELRSLYDVYGGTKPKSTAMMDALTEKITRVSLLSVMTKYKVVTAVSSYNNLVLLEIGSLRSRSFAEQVRDRAAKLPHTMLAFVGATNHDVVIAFHVSMEKSIHGEEELLRILSIGYKRLHYMYSAQLGLSVDTKEPSLASTCLVSHDPQTYYNPQSESFYIDDTLDSIPVYRHGYSDHYSEDGTDSYISKNLILEWCLSDALKNARQVVSSDAEMAEATLSLLAGYCHDSALEMDYAIARVKWKPMFSGISDDLIQKVFENAYNKKLNRSVPFGHIEPSALMTYRMEAFVDAHYLLRRNVMTGEVQYKTKTGYDYEYHPLTEQVLNSMTNKALKAGLGTWDKDMKRLLNSNEIEEFCPLESYLDGLPQWDGKDRVESLFARLPIEGNKGFLGNCFRVWLLSMVAHWMGKEGMRGNSLVPLLIGGQGCGKTTFCNMLLPTELYDYFNDKVDFKNETALAMGLSRFALINIDEFDSLKKSQQPVLKYLLSKGDVKLRLPYGRHFVTQRRYASFIATTNSMQPLTDPTGSRRFVCMHVAEGKCIDCSAPIEHAQLYAQLKQMVIDGERYWLNDDEISTLTGYNARFLRISDLGMIIDNLFAVPSDGNSGKLLLMSEIVSIITENYRDFPVSRSFSIEVGKLLKAKGFATKHTNRGQAYEVIKKSWLTGNVLCLPV